MRHAAVRIGRVLVYAAVLAVLGAVPWLALFLAALLDVMEQRHA